MNIDKVLVPLASAVLRECLGRGEWQTYMPPPLPPLCECVVGVAVGNKLWCFDEDEDCTVANTVVHVDREGRAYYIVRGPYGLAVEPMLKECFFRTPEEAAKDWCADNRLDLEYHERHIRNIKETARLAGIPDSELT